MHKLMKPFSQGFLLRLFLIIMTLSLLSGGTNFIPLNTVHGEEMQKKDTEKENPIANIKLSQEVLELAAGETKPLEVRILPPKSGDLPLVWTTSDPAVAAVSGTGAVTGVGSGSATITASSPDGRKSDTASIQVYGFRIGLSDTVGAGQSVTMPLSYTTQTDAAVGPVSFAIEKLSGEGNVSFSAVDSQGQPVNFRNSGVYMPEGFTMPAGFTHTTDWNVKFSKIGTYELAFKLTAPSGSVLQQVKRTVKVEPSIMNLGHQVFKDGILRGAFGKENGKPVGYTVISSQPDSRFVVIDVDTEEVLKQFDLPNAEGAWGIYPANNGKVYFGTYNTATVFEYDPAINQVIDLKAELPNGAGGALFYEMDEDRDGNIYIGSYPGNKLWKFDPGTRKIIDLGEVTAGQSYSRTMVYDETVHALYIASGGNKASLVKYDIATGTKTELLPEAYRTKYNLVYDLTLVGEKLFIKLDPNFGMYVLNVKTGELKDFGAQAIQSRGTTEKSPYEDKVYFTYGGFLKEYDLKTDKIADVTNTAGRVNLTANVVGWKIMELNDLNFPGYTLVGFNGASGGAMFKYNLQTKMLRMTNVKLPLVPLKLHTLGAAEDGNIYAAAFLPGGVGIFNPATGASSSNSFRQVEGMTAAGGKMYFGVYPGAIIYEYDTTKPWKSSGSGQTVVNKFELKGFEQDRPYAMLNVPQEGKIFIGTAPTYAVNGGALTIYDPKVTPAKYDVYRNIVQDQAIISIAYKERKIYGGTSFRGGLGVDWPYADGRLFVFDVATGQKDYDVIPVPGKGAINKVIAGPDGNIWGFAQGTFFVFDPVQKKVIHTYDAFPEASETWRGAEMEISVKDGHVYGAAGDHLFRIDKDTKEMTILAEDATHITQDKMGNFYFTRTADENALWRWTIEDNTTAVNHLSLNKSELNLTIGDTETLTATVLPEFATLKTVTWSSGNEAIAKVGPTGTVTALAAGTTMITATSADGKLAAQAHVMVKERIFSTYSLTWAGPASLIEGVYGLFPLSVTTEKLGKQPTENAFYEIEKIAGSGSVTFVYLDAQGVSHSFTDKGEYGMHGLTIPAQANDKMNWSLLFNQPGEYTISVSLKDSAGVEIGKTAKTISVQQKPAHSSYKFSSTVTSVTYEGTVPLTLDSVIPGLEGYADAKISLENLSVATGSVSFQLTENAHTNSFTNMGILRPDGFAAGSNHNETLPLSVRFDKPGMYTIRAKLLASTGAVIGQNDIFVTALLPNKIELVNAGFEQPMAADGTLPGWGSWGTNIRKVETSSEQAYSGTYSLKYIDDMVGANAVRTTPSIVVPGKTYQGSVLFYNMGPSKSVQIYLDFLDANGARVGVSFKGVSAELNEWTPLFISGTAPANAKSVTLMVYTSRDPILTGYMDEAALSHD